MKIITAITALWLLTSSCGNHASEPEKTSKEKSFFPVAEYIKGEIRLIDSLPVGIMKKLTRGSKKDTGFIERSEFHQLASAFTDTALSESNMESHYTEHSFMDETTGSYTFTYEPVSTGAPFNRIDVLVKPGQSSDRVKSIYLEKDYTQNDTSINERFYWKANTSFSIIREKKYKDQNPVVEHLLVIWDPSAY